jgi:hypothetical protein
MDLTGWEFVPARRGLQNDGLTETERKRAQRRATQTTLSKAARISDQAVDQ